MLLLDLFQTVLICGFPGGSDSKESAYDAGDPGSIPGSGRSLGEGDGYPIPVLFLGTFLTLYLLVAKWWLLGRTNFRGQCSNLKNRF